MQKFNTFRGIRKRGSSRRHSAHKAKLHPMQEVDRKRRKKNTHGNKTENVKHIKDAQAQGTNSKLRKRWDYRLGTVSSKNYWGFKAGLEWDPNLTLVPSLPQKNKQCKYKYPRVIRAQHSSKAVTVSIICITFNMFNIPP